MKTTISKRYSQEDLADFKANIEKKMARELDKLKRLEKTLKDTAEAMAEEGDWTDDTFSQNDLHLQQTLVYRQRKHVNDYQNALQRIHNKSYGICVVTGELIDKRRLLAIPTTTKSIAAKTGHFGSHAPTKAVMDTEAEEEENRKPAPKVKAEPAIFSRVIRRSNPNVIPSEVSNISEADDDDDDLSEDGMVNYEEEFDFDSIAIEDENDDSL